MGELAGEKVDTAVVLNHYSCFVPFYCALPGLPKKLSFFPVIGTF